MKITGSGVVYKSAEEYAKSEKVRENARNLLHKEKSMYKAIHITSKYGPRWRNRKKEFHYGLDIRSWDFTTWQRIPFTLPEDVTIMAIEYSKKWGEEVKLRLEDTGGYLTVRHIDVVDALEAGDYIPAGKGIGVSMRTEYMRKVGAGEHYHIELDNYQDPLPYFKENGYTIHE